jgi:outer membrane protein TolC
MTCGFIDFRRVAALLLALVVTGMPAAAQERLTLQGAIDRALHDSPVVRAAVAAQGEAAAGVDQARAGWLPRVDYIESWQRSNQPVFVFGSLLAQSRFTAQNFALDPLNHPDAISNYRSGLNIDQPIFDASQRWRAKAAQLGRDIAVLSGVAARRDVALAVTRAYGNVLVANAARRAAEAALRSSQEDLTLAERRRSAGLVTDADVLALRVHASGMEARVIQATGDATVARAALNDAMGAPLDAMFAVDEVPLTAAPAATAGAAALEQGARATRESAKQAAAGTALATANRGAVVGAFIPQVSFQGGYEFDGAQFSNRQTWWAAGVQVRWNLFSGLADRARLRAADEGIARARAEQERAENGVRLEVRSALARLEAARGRERVGRAAVDQAREAQRIIRDRYEAGLMGITDVLRASNTLLEAELQRVSALVDVMVGEAVLERAVGSRQ